MPRTDPFVGISVSDDHVRAVAVDAASLEPIAASAALLTSTLTEAFREALRGLHVRPGGVATGLGLDRATVRRISLPRTSAANMDRVVRFEAERHIPLPIDNVEFDYHAEPDAATDRLEVVVAAARKEDAAQLSRSLADATSAPVILDTTGTALLAAWDAAGGGTGDAVLLVDLSGAHAALVACQGGTLALARFASTGVNALRGALAEDLKISLTEAESVRAERGVAGALVGPPDLVAEPETTGLEQTSEWLTTLVQEVRRTLESFRSQRGGLQRCPVALTGEGADTPGLVAALGGALGDPVSIFDPLQGRAVVLPGPGHEFAAAYGLALRAAGRSPIRVDLSPRAERAGRERRQRATGWLALAGVVALSLLAAYVYASSRLERTERQLARVQADLRERKKQVGDLEVTVANADAVSQVQERLAALDRVEARPLDILDGVSLSLPGGVWLTDFSYDLEKGVGLRGDALDAASITEAVRALSRKPYLTRVKLNSIAIVNIGAKPVYAFEINGDFRQPEESASPKKTRATRKQP